MSHWALPFIGAPWISGESGPAGYDCYGLVRAVYRDVQGIVLPVVDVTQAEPLRLRHTLQSEAAAAWDEVQQPADLDVLMLSYGENPHHIGLWAEVDGGRVVHALEGAGVVAQSRSALAGDGWHIVAIRRRRVGA